VAAAARLSGNSSGKSTAVSISRKEAEMVLFNVGLVCAAVPRRFADKHSAGRHLVDMEKDKRVIQLTIGLNSRQPVACIINL